MSDTASRIAHGAIAAAAFGLLGTAAWRALGSLNFTLLRDLAATHGTAVVGVPVAALMATAVVSWLRFFDGNFAFKFLSIEAEGAIAALFGWLLIFSSLVVAVRALW